MKLIELISGLIDDFIDAIATVIAAIIGIVIFCLPPWFIYKVFAGIFYLLDKLIDKL